MTVSQSKRVSRAIHGSGTSNKATVATSTQGGTHASGRRSSKAEAVSAGGLASYSSAGPSASPTKLRGITEAEIGAWKAAVDNPVFTEYDFGDLDESIDYPFKKHDSVWIHSGEDNWYLGRVVGKNILVGQTRQSKQGFYYPVCYGKKMNLRKYCSPLNGNMKPDTKKFRDQLRKWGLLDDDDEYMSDSSSSNTGSNYSDSL